MAKRRGRCRLWATIHTIWDCIRHYVGCVVCIINDRQRGASNTCNNTSPHHRNYTNATFRTTQRIRGRVSLRPVSGRKSASACSLLYTYIASLFIPAWNAGHIDRVYHVGMRCWCLLAACPCRGIERNEYGECVCEHCVVAWLAARTAHGLVVLLVVLVVSVARLAGAECESMLKRESRSVERWRESIGKLNR